MWFSVLPAVKFLQYSSCSPGSMLFSAGEEARLRGMVSRRRRLGRLRGTNRRSCHLLPILWLQPTIPPAMTLTTHLSARWFFTGVCLNSKQLKCVSGFACSVAAGAGQLHNSGDESWAELAAGQPAPSLRFAGELPNAAAGQILLHPLAFFFLQ